MSAADGDAVFLPSVSHDPGGQLAFDIAAGGAVLDRQVGRGERQLDVAADRLEAVLLPRIEPTFDLHVAAHGVQQARTQPRGGDRDVTAHGVALEVPDITPAIDVAAHGLEPHRPLEILEPHVTGDRLDLERSAHAFDGELAAHGLRVDRALRGYGDVEVDTEALPAEEIEPSALLLVQVRLDEKLVAPLLHPDLEVLQEALRPVLAAGAHSLARDHPDLAGGAGGGDRRFARDVPDVQPRRVLEREPLFERLRVALAAKVADEVADERTGELTGVELAAVHREAAGAGVEFEPMRLLLGAPRGVLGVARRSLHVALRPACLALRTSLLTPMTLTGGVLVPRRVAFVAGRVRLALVVAFFGHAVGSLSSRFAASSAAMRPSASSRRISLRRSFSRSGSACDGKPSARIIASRRERTVGYEMPSSRSMSLKLPRARMNVSRNSS